MSSSRRGARLQPAGASASGCVRTLDVYPIKPASPSCLSLSPLQKVPSPSPLNVFAGNGVSSILVAHTSRTSPQRTTQERKNVAASQSGVSELQGVRSVTEDEYRLSPQEIQRRVQETLVAQVRSLLETRLQQRLQLARQTQRSQATEADRATVAASADTAVLDELHPSFTPNVTYDGAPPVRVEAAETSAPGRRLADPLPLSTTRLATPAAVSAPAAAVAAADPAKYADTIDAYPYSAVELVRVHRLKGVPDHNRGLFAALARRSFTTRSGHLVVNPDLAGKGRVRSAVAGHVWEEQRNQANNALHADPQRQGQRQHNSNVHNDETLVTSANSYDKNFNNDSSASAVVRSRAASSACLAPPRLVMKVVGDGNRASFVWAEEEPSYDVANSAWHFSHSVKTPLSAAVVEVLDHKYGKPLTGQERAEAERRLRARRHKEQQQQRQQLTANDGKANGASRVESNRDTDPKTPAFNIPSTISTNNGANPSDVDLGLAGDASATRRPTILTHDLLPTTCDKDGPESLTPSDRHVSSTSTADGGAPSTAATTSSSRLPPNSTSTSGVDAAGQRPRPPSLWGQNCAPASRAGLSISELDHTMSVGEAQERQRDRQTRAEHSSRAAQAGGGTASTSAGPKNEQETTANAPPGGGLPSPMEGKEKGNSKNVGGANGRQTPPYRDTPCLDTTHNIDALEAHEITAEANAEGATATAGTSGGDSGFEAQSNANTASGLPTFPRRSTSSTAAASGKVGARTGSRANAAAEQKKNDAEQKRLDSFLEHFPEAQSHVRLRREAKNVLDELENMWDEEGPTSERPFPLPQFASREYNFTDSEDDNADEDRDQRHRHGGRGHGRPSRGCTGADQQSEEPAEEPVVGFDVDVSALQEKFKAEAAEECADLTARRDALLAEVVAQRQLIRDFGDDVHFLSVGSVASGLSAEQYAVELTREVNAYARKNHLRFNRLTMAEGGRTGNDALTLAAMAKEEEGEMTLGFIERFGSEKIPTRDVGCQVSDADLCYVDAAVRSTEAQLESLLHHEKALLNAVRMATVAVANILSFHASLEMECTCHECFFIFDKPRSLWPCGHTFCHACLSTMYNAHGDLICAECGSACEVGYTPNVPMELIANYQTVYARSDADTKGAPSSALAEEREAQTIEGVLRSLLNDLLSTQHSWGPASPRK